MAFGTWRPSLAENCCGRATNSEEEITSSQQKVIHGEVAPDEVCKHHHLRNHLGPTRSRATLPSNATLPSVAGFRWSRPLQSPAGGRTL